MFAGHQNQNQLSVLLVDDDSELVSMMAELLRNEGMQVRTAGTEKTAMQLLQAAIPNALILDVMLPDANGLDLCRRLRAQAFAAPILMLTARGEPMDRVLGLELGADDYLSKPFDPRELVARIRALCRRGWEAQASTTLLRFGLLELDLVRFRAVHDGKPVLLTSSEFKLLHALARRCGTPMSREALSLAVQPRNYVPLDRAVDVQVARLRKKLSAASAGHDWITTVRGVGYVFSSP